MSNFFDQLSVDIDYIYNKFQYWDNYYSSRPNSNLKKEIRSVFDSIYKTQVLPLVIRRFFRRLLRQAQIDLTWLSIFNEYWTTVLNGRPLWSPHDFYFLKNTYRLKFQNVNISDNVENIEHLLFWQKPAVVYQLFHLASKESLSDEIELLKLKRKFCSHAKTILEFGAGTAPIATSWKQLNYPRRKYKWIIADIKTIAFHYACYKFRNSSDIVPLLLTPEKSFLPDEYLRVDVVFCITVLEHLQNPLEVIERLHKNLATNGIIMFDYILSDGTGLDTISSIRERKPVLEFINKKFNIVYGTIDSGFQESVGLTIAQKK